MESLDDGTRFLQAGLSRIEFEMAEGANVALFLAPFEGVNNVAQTQATSRLRVETVA